MALLVDDEGPGVPEADRERVFSRFFRGSGDVGHPDPRRGVGLAIVAEYAASHGRDRQRRVPPQPGAPASCVPSPRAQRHRRSRRCPGCVIGSRPCSPASPSPLVAAAVVLLLRGAETEGIDALAQAKIAQVPATANSFNARVAVPAHSRRRARRLALGAHPRQRRRPGASCKTYDVDPNAQSGFFLVDAYDTVTAGVLLRPGAVGSSFPPRRLGRSQERSSATTPAIALPVTAQGLTTDLPSYDFVVAIPGARPAPCAARW